MELKEAIKKFKTLCVEKGRKDLMSEGIRRLTEAYKKMNEIPVQDKDLAYLEGEDRDNYIHDMKIAQKWADVNRKTIAEEICKGMNWKAYDSFTTIHNYLGDDNVIRKSAISAKLGEKVLIPLNMRDGSIIGIGKGNTDWNESAPHGAGRAMSRTKAKASLDLETFKESMTGIYTTTACSDTLDEAPQAYKPSEKIVEQIRDTVDVIEVVKPIYNFKATES